MIKKMILKIFWFLLAIALAAGGYLFRNDIKTFISPDPCKSVICENNGTPKPDTAGGCACECPNGFIGTECESFDITKVQALLDGGKTPKELYDGTVPLDSLYGKTYEGGLIFYLNTDNGTGMVAATENQGRAEWGCNKTDIKSLNNVSSVPSDPETVEGARIGDGQANTDAILAECKEEGIIAKLCRDYRGGGHQDWFFPSRAELNLMYTNLHTKGHGGFAATKVYYSSTEWDDNVVWALYFKGGIQYEDAKGSLRFRAARAF